MAEFEMSGTLQKKLADKLRPQMNRLARDVADTARRLAPRDKHWVNMGDEDVRHEHRYVEPVPSNLRFTLRSPEYDRSYYGAGATQMGPRPGKFDVRGINGFTSGLTANCRCELYTSADSMLAEKVQAHLSTDQAGKIRVSITCDHPMAADSEFGNSIDEGARWLGQAIRETAARLGVKRIASR